MQKLWPEEQCKHYLRRREEGETFYAQSFLERHLELQEERWVLLLLLFFWSGFILCLKEQNFLIHDMKMKGAAPNKYFTLSLTYLPHENSLKPPLGSIWVKKYDINSGSECSFWGDRLQISVNLELTWNMKEDKNYFHLKWHSFSNNVKENAHIVSPEIMYTTAIQMWSSWEGNWDLFAASGTQLIGWEDEHTEILTVILAAGTLLPLLKKLHFFLSSGSWRLTALWSPSPQMGQRINIR